ncbi:MAG: hypothetical protein LBC92_05045, partial [Rickettsiales bacterium]|nr:hypothetical protein [Rickettsiales bacterium]
MSNPNVILNEDCEFIVADASRYLHYDVIKPDPDNPGTSVIAGYNNSDSLNHLFFSDLNSSSSSRFQEYNNYNFIPEFTLNGNGNTLTIEYNYVEERYVGNLAPIQIYGFSMGNDNVVININNINFHIPDLFKSDKESSMISTDGAPHYNFPPSSGYLNYASVLSYRNVTEQTLDPTSTLNATLNNIKLENSQIYNTAFNFFAYYYYSHYNNQVIALLESTLNFSNITITGNTLRQADINEGSKIAFIRDLTVALTDGTHSNMTKTLQDILIKDNTIIIRDDDNKGVNNHGETIALFKSASLILMTFLEGKNLIFDNVSLIDNDFGDLVYDNEVSGGGSIEDDGMTILLQGKIPRVGALFLCVGFFQNLGCSSSSFTSTSQNSGIMQIKNLIVKNKYGEGFFEQKDYGILTNLIDYNTQLYSVILDGGGYINVPVNIRFSADPLPITRASTCGTVYSSSLEECGKYYTALYEPIYMGGISAKLTLTGNVILAHGNFISNTIKTEGATSLYLLNSFRLLAGGGMTFSYAEFNGSGGYGIDITSGSSTNIYFSTDPLNMVARINDGIVEKIENDIRGQIYNSKFSFAIKGNTTNPNLTLNFQIDSRAGEIGYKVLNQIQRPMITGKESVIFNLSLIKDINIFMVDGTDGLPNLDIGDKIVLLQGFEEEYGYYAGDTMSCGHNNSSTYCPKFEGDFKASLKLLLADVVVQVLNNGNEEYHFMVCRGNKEGGNGGIGEVIYAQYLGTEDLPDVSCTLEPLPPDPPIDPCEQDPSLCPPPDPDCVNNPTDPLCPPPDPDCLNNPTDPLCPPPDPDCLNNPTDPLCPPSPDNNNSSPTNVFSHSTSFSESRLSSLITVNS